MVTVLRVPFAPALPAAGAAFFLAALALPAWAGDLDAPMQPIGRGAAVPLPGKHPSTVPGDSNSDLPVHTPDRVDPEYSGDSGARAAEPDPMDALVDRTAGTIDSVSTATSNILRLERP